MNIKFFRCLVCKQIAVKLVDKDNPLFCCGKQMEELIPNSIDASKEKHVPVITTNGNVCKVSIGSIAHPMEQAHYIMWVILLTNKGYYKKDLNPNDLPEVTFNLDNDEKVSKQYNKNYKTI